MDPRPDPDSPVLRIPPQSMEAEQAVLGGLMLDNSAWDRAGDLLRSDDFYSMQHRAIYEAIGHLINALKPADVITVFERIQRMAETRAHGYAAGVTLEYLNSLAESTPSARNMRGYATIVREKAAERRLISALENAATRAWNAEGTAADKLDEICNELAQLERTHATPMPRSMDQLVVERLDHITELHEGKELPGMATGFPELDVLLNGGLHPGRVYLLGGRPGMGKSTLSLWIALHRALNFDDAVLYLSQEMPATEVTDRALAGIGGINYANLQTGKLTNDEWKRMSEAVEKLARIPFHVDEQTGLNANEIGVRMRYVKGIKVAVLDYVQLCAGMGERDSTRTEQLAVVSRACKTLAKALHCAVIVLSGLARKVDDDRKNKRALMADFRDCGQLEADADVILSLFPLRSTDSNGRRIIGLDVLKNRQGSLGVIALDFWGSYMQWEPSEYKAEDLLAPEKKHRGDDL